MLQSTSVLRFWCLHIVIVHSPKCQLKYTYKSFYLGLIGYSSMTCSFSLNLLFSFLFTKWIAQFNMILESDCLGSCITDSEHCRCYLIFKGSRGSSIVVEPINTGTAIVKAKLKDKAFAVSDFVRIAEQCCYSKIQPYNPPPPLYVTYLLLQPHFSAQYLYFRLLIFEKPLVLSTLKCNQTFVTFLVA